MLGNAFDSPKNYYITDDYDSHNLCCFTEESRCKTRPPYFSIKWWIKKIFTYRFPRIRSGVSHDAFVMMTWCTHDASHDAFLSQPANFDVSKAIILTLVSILSSRIRCRTNLQTQRQAKSIFHKAGLQTVSIWKRLCTDVATKWWRHSRHRAAHKEAKKRRYGCQRDPPSTWNILWGSRNFGSKFSCSCSGDWW